MNYSLESPSVGLALNLEEATFYIESRNVPGWKIQRARMRLNYQPVAPWLMGRRIQRMGDWRQAGLSKVERMDSAHGPLDVRRLILPPDEHGVAVEVIFAVSQTLPMLTWRVRLQNQGNAPVSVGKLEMLEAGYLPPPSAADWRSYQPGQITFPQHPPEPVFFSNGWGSWDDTRTYATGERFRRTHLGPITLPMRKNPGTPHPYRTSCFSSDMFGVLGDRTSQTGMLLGFLSQRQHFGSLETYLNPLGSAISMWANGDQARLDPGSRLETDWACLFFIQTHSPDPLGLYMDAVAREHGLALPQEGELHTGWCSWYQFFTQITAEIIQRNLAEATRLRTDVPMTLFQIDDGYQAALGDWLTTQPAFPEGMAPLAAAARQSGMQPGLWIAPFTVHPRSELARRHPNWLLRNRWGRPVSAGWNWGVFHNALDLTHPEALAYVGEVIETTAHQWGYGYLKLDFLYAGALAGIRHDPSFSRAQALRRAFALIREKAGPQTELLACGSPLGPAIGLFDAMRIGPDVAPRWYAKEMGVSSLIRDEPGMPSARNAVHNTLLRAPMHRRWWINDGDCLVVRPDSDLTLAEVQSVASALALTGSPLLLSDDLAALPRERLEILHALLPLLGGRASILDAFDRPNPRLARLNLDGPTGPWQLFALFNWDDRPQTLALTRQEAGLLAGDYLVRSFWSGQAWRWEADFPALSVDLPAHGCAVLAIRAHAANQPAYLGSSLHISQGVELAAWQTAPGQVTLDLLRPGPAEGVFDLWLPGKVTLSQQSRPGSAEWQPLAPPQPTKGLPAQVMRFAVAFDRETRIEVNYA